MSYKFKILNTREVKEILAELKEHFGTEAMIEDAMVEGGDGKIYLISRKFGEIDQSKLRINNLGLYFCKRENNGFKPTIEGSQIIKPVKNVFEMNEKQRDLWMQGEDLTVGALKMHGLVILRHNNDFYGTGAYKEGRILNFIPKEKRLKTKAEED